MIPEAAASAEPSPKASAMMRSTRTPSRRVVSMSLEMARMARPGLVRWMIHRSPSTSTKLTTGTTSVIGSSFSCPKLMGVMSHSGWYTGRGRPENTTTERLSMKKDTAMALMSAEMRGASRRGR